MVYITANAVVEALMDKAELQKLITSKEELFFKEVEICRLKRFRVLGKKA